jgi:hypothetical protein
MTGQGETAVKYLDGGRKPASASSIPRGRSGTAP